MATEPFEHDQIEVNGIGVHTVSAGKGPLVVFCHGFPESWYSWRHQLPAVAEAGFRAMVHPRTVSTNSGAPIPVRIGSMTSSGSKDESQLSVVNDLRRLGSLRSASANLDVHQNVWIAGLIGGLKHL